MRVGGEGSCVVILCAWDFRYAQIDHNTRITRHRLGTRNLSAGRSAHYRSSKLNLFSNHRKHPLRTQQSTFSEAETSADEEAETSADKSRADPGTGEPEQTAPAAEGTLGRGTRRAATSTDYGLLSVYTR